MKIKMLGIYCRTSREESTSGIKTIVQQKELGVKFAKDNGFEFEVYEDEGKSGYKYDDEENPFKNRPAFKKLLDDIAEKKITDVWVWENSRLSREHFSQALVYKIFEKNDIIFWENGRKYDLHQPADKLTKSILDAVGEYERQEIILRTSRGQRASFNSGKNRHGSMFGYKNDKLTRTTTPVPEELETAKKIFDDYLKGLNLREIGREYFTNGNPETSKLLSVVAKVKKIISHEEYTSESLKISGRAIEADFRSGKGADLQELRKDEYWVKSVFYTEKIIDRDTWISANEKLEWTRRSLAKKTNKKSRETNNSLASGIMKCATCGSNYYFKDVGNRGGLIYRHLATVDKCSQHPIQIQTRQLDTILDVFFTFYYLIFDDTSDRLRQMKLSVKKNTKVLNKQLAELEKNRNQIQRIIEIVNHKLADGIFDNNPDAFIETMSTLADYRKKSESLSNEIKLKTLEIEENKAKDSELTRNEKYQLGTIERIQKWFELRELNSYTELRIMLRDALFDGFITIDGNILSIYAGDPSRAFYFDVSHDYKVVYPFIEKVIDRNLNKTYSELETMWINSKKEVLGSFGMKVKDFLKSRPDRKPEELFENNDFLFLSDCFNVSYDYEGLNVFTDTETRLMQIEYYTTDQVSGMLGVPKSTLRSWASKHGIKTYFATGIKTLLWTSEDIERYKNRPKHVVGFKHSEETKKHWSEIRKGRKQSEETKKKRSESMKKAWSTVSEEDRKKRTSSLQEYNKRVSESGISEETRKKLSEASKGRKQSEETRKKRSESMKKTLAEKRKQKPEK